MRGRGRGRGIHPLAAVVAVAAAAMLINKIQSSLVEMMVGDYYLAPTHLIVILILIAIDEGVI